MNLVWSTYIQKIGTLYYSRQLRFSDIYKENYKKAFMIDDKKSILEIGCGPGALSQSLCRWYPNSSIVGIDRDSSFIEFAREKSSSCSFIEGDATNLPFEDESFDVVISYTVQEHIEPSKFFGEQFRVLKPKGVCLVLSARRGINIKADIISEESELEKSIYSRKDIDKCYDEIHNKYSIGAYSFNESELPRVMAQYGFKNISTNYLTINLTPDNPSTSKETAYAIINENRQNDLDGVEALYEISAGAVKLNEIEKLKVIINSKYNERLKLYDAGIKQWDTNMSLNLILRGTK